MRWSRRVLNWGDSMPALKLSDEVINTYLSGGQWSAEAEDNIAGESVSGDFIQQLVTAYSSDPASVAARQGLGLVALLLGIAEWGVTGNGLPQDPAEKGWNSDTGEDSGKHLMSYAVGGVGISHADVGDPKKYVKWLGASDLVPTAPKPALQRLPTGQNPKTGIPYHPVRAAGRCSASPDKQDLLGEALQPLD